MTTTVLIKNPHLDRVVRISKRNQASGKNILTMTVKNGELVEYIHAGQYLVISEHGEYEDADINEGFNGLSFGLAVEALKLGKKVCRAGWNGKGMWLVYVAGDVYEVARDVLISIEAPDRKNSNFLPWIGMKTADNKFVPWLASQTDVLADDWMIVE